MFIKIGDMLINTSHIQRVMNVEGQRVEFEMISSEGEFSPFSFCFTFNDPQYNEAIGAYNALCKGAMTFDTATALDPKNTPSFFESVSTILHKSTIGYTDGESRPDGTARMTIARYNVEKLDSLPLTYDLIWRTDTSARIEVLSIGDKPKLAPFTCECCGVECNGSVRNGHLYCQECLTELDEPYE